MQNLLIGGVRATLALCVVLGASMYPAEDARAERAVARAITEMTGLQPVMKHMHVQFFKTVVGIKDMMILNPAGFRDEGMLDFSEIVANYSFVALVRGRAKFTNMKIHVRELTIVKNEKGELNLSALRALNRSEPEGAREGDFSLHVDVLELQIDRVVYKDYTQGDVPVIQEFDVHVIERVEHITSPDELVALIICRALARTPLNNLDGISQLRPERMLSAREP